VIRAMIKSPLQKVLNQRGQIRASKLPIAHNAATSGCQGRY
jgi:hypothetical protein